MTNTDIRPLFEQIIRRHSVASQNGMRHEFKQAHELAKAAYDGLILEENILRKTAEKFKRRDNVVFNSLNSIADIIARQMRLF